MKIEKFLKDNNIILIDNISKTIKNNQLFKNQFGDFKIIGKTNIHKNNRYDYYLIQFIDDETIMVAYRVSIINGQIKNKNKPNVCNIGFLGYGKYMASFNNKDTKEYKLWHAMIHRCYDKKYQIKQPTYIGCTIDKRWHNFQNFCEDIEQLENYDKWKNSTKEREYCLDKDIKIKGNKIYSKTNCKFVTFLENSSEAKITGKKYIATRISDNYQEEFTNQREFASKYNLFQSGINKCLKKGQSSHKGWRFIEKEEK